MCHTRGIPVTQEVYMSWVYVHMSWVYLLGIRLGWHEYVLGSCLYLLGNNHLTRATQEVYVSHKRYTCNPRGIYVLGISLGYTSWVTGIPLASHHMFIRGMLSKRYTCTQEVCTSRNTVQDIYPRGIPKTYIPLGWQVYLLGIYLGMYSYVLDDIFVHTSWVYLLGCSIPLGLYGVLLMFTPLSFHSIGYRPSNASTASLTNFWS